MSTNMQRGTCEVILKGGGECEALGSNPSIKREDEQKKKKKGRGRMMKGMNRTRVPCVHI
jgi:hypothetical protein